MRYHPKPYKMIKVSDEVRYPHATTIQYVGWGVDVRKHLLAHAKKMKYKEPRIYNPALNNKDVDNPVGWYTFKQYPHPYRLGCSCPHCEATWYQMKVHAND